MPEPFISICIPAFRAEKFLPAALATVRAQSFTDWELIVTEDGSKDSTEQLVSAFASGGPQPVIYNRHEKNRGLPATRNTGIAAARGTWVAFLDSDDLWQPTHLADLVTAARTGDYDVVYAGSQIFDDATGATLELRAPTPQDIAAFPTSLYDSRVIIQPSSAMVRRAGFSRFGLFSEEYPICNDMEFWVRVAAGGGQFRYTGQNTCRYRKHGGAMSTKSAALIAETGRICESYRGWTAVPAAVRRRRPASLYRDAGRILLRSEPRRARVLLGQSLRLQPGSPTTVVYWAAAALRSFFPV